MEKLLAIANSYAEEFCSDAIHPAHLFKAILHKELGLIDFIEKELDKDYYYLLDWADVQVQLAPRSARPKRDLEFCAESEAVEKEAENYRAKFGLEEVDAVCWLASLVTPGVGFSFDELKTLPLTPAEIAAVKGTAKGGATIEAYPTHPAETKKATGTGAIGKYCINKIAEAAGLSKVDAKKALEATLEAISDALKAGDKVMTVGGIHVTIVSTNELQAQVEIAPSVRVKMSKASLRPIPEQKTK